MSNRPQTSAINLGNCVFVSTTGNDGTGLRERLDKPFATPLAGLAAAQSGDTLIVYPGDYVLSEPLQVNKGVAFEFIGNGTVTSSGTIFSDNGVTGLYLVDIMAPGWTFDSGDSECIAFSAWDATKKARFVFGTVRSRTNTGINVYSIHPIEVLLEGNNIISDTGTPLIATGELTVRNCRIETQATENQDAILMGGGRVIFEHCTIFAGGGVEGTDAIGMDGGELVLRDCSVTSEGADALTLRGGGKASLWGCDITGLATALRVNDTISVDAFASRFNGEIVKADTASIAFYGCKTV